MKTRTFILTCLLAMPAACSSSEARLAPAPSTQLTSVAGAPAVTPPAKPPPQGLPEG